jgi:hypothetical protein
MASPKKPKRSLGTRDLYQALEELIFGKLILAHITDGAKPIFWNIFESGPRLDAVVRIPNGRIIHVSANFAGIGVHDYSPTSNPKFKPLPLAS